MKSIARPARQGGYSMTEMLIAVAIIGAMALVAVPNMVGRSVQMRLERGTAELTGQLRVARSQAVSRSVNVIVTFNPSTKVFTMRGDYDHSGSVEGDEIESHTLQGMDGISLTGPGYKAVFLPMGSLVSDANPWVVHLSAPEADDRYVYVFKSGQVQVLEAAL